jgi:glycosyltransferase involved in cell wall biosynthesis
MTEDRPQPGDRDLTIAFLLPSMNGGGAERVALRLMTSLVEAGYRVELLLMRKKGELLDLLPPKIEVIDLGASKVRQAIGPLVRYFRERPPHAIQIRMWPLTVAGLIARSLARARVRVVVSDHAALSKQYGDQPAAFALLKATTRMFYPRADARLVVADGVADDLAKLSGMKRSSIEVIYNPVPAPPAGVCSTPEIEALWGAPDGRILTVGALIDAKNHALLVRSFARLRRRRPARLMILGQGDLLASIQHHAAEQGVAEDVILPGFTIDPWPYYASANLFVLSSDYEGYPNVLVEAMRSGLSVVSTDCISGPREILGRSEYGSLVPVGDEAALAQAMEEALARPTDPDLVRRRAEEISGAGTTRRYLQLLLGPEGGRGAGG